jgi:hypothetical protein
MNSNVLILRACVNVKLFLELGAGGGSQGAGKPATPPHGRRAGAVIALRERNKG